MLCEESLYPLIIDSIINAFLFTSDTCYWFFNIRSAMVSNHLELTKRQTQDRYGRFASPLSHTSPPSSRQKVESSGHCCTAPPPSRMQVGSSSHRRTALPPSSDDSSVEMWEVPPPPSTSMGDSSSTSSGYNNACPHIREVSSYEHCFYISIV
jgi:hypothetical protein